MIQHQTHVRVRYADTDQMGFVYYGKYAEYFEVGRVELIRSVGLSYKEIEERGVWLPVVELRVNYRYPARYDELLTITSCLAELPKASLLTTYKIHKENGELAVSGLVKLAFLNAERQRPQRVPDFFLKAVEQYWKPETESPS